MPGGKPPEKPTKNSNKTENKIKEKEDQLMCLTSDSDEDSECDDIRHDLDAEELKEIKDMVDDGVQNQLNFTDSDGEEGEESTSSPDKSKSDTEGREKKEKPPRYVIPGEEDENEEWILDHTGVKRKPFKVMHREIRDIIKDKIVIAHNLPKDFAYLRITRHDCLRTLDTSLIKMFQRKNLRRKLKDLTYEYVDARIQLTSNHSPVSFATHC
jgi:hypothetical protein